LAGVRIRVRVRDRRPMFAIAPLKLHVSLTFFRHTGRIKI